MNSMPSNRPIAIPVSGLRTRTREMWGFCLVLLGAAFLLLQTLSAQAQIFPQTFADLAEEISPSVVNITTSTRVLRSDAPESILPEGSPFEEFFREFGQRRGENTPLRRTPALGSGFVISEDGYIVTNNHVIENADEIVVEFFSGKELEATIVGADPNTDIALLKVESDEPLEYVPFGDSDEARVGDWVVAMGNPMGQGFSVSAGIISARGRTLSGSYDDYIQTDAAINRGNSGGPLFNIDGQVIGVNTAILSPTGGSVGIGFSMASNVVMGVVDQLQSFGETRRGWLGVNIQNVNANLAEAFGLGEAMGAAVTDVPEGPARDAGVRVNDIIIRFDGKKVEDTRSLIRMVGDAPVGKTVELVVVRGGMERSYYVTLGRRETSLAVPAAVPRPMLEPEELDMLGMRLTNLDDDIRGKLELPNTVEGLLILSLDEGGKTFEQGLRQGDIILEVQQQRVASLRDFRDAVEAVRDEGKNSVLLLVRRGETSRFIALNVNQG